jgi:hypothetical protein
MEILLAQVIACPEMQNTGSLLALQKDDTHSYLRVRMRNAWSAPKIRC